MCAGWVKIVDRYTICMYIIYKNLIFSPSNRQNIEGVKRDLGAPYGPRCEPHRYASDPGVDNKDRSPLRTITLARVPSCMELCDWQMSIESMGYVIIFPEHLT